MAKKKIGLALSGGGAKGVVHAGMIHYFDEIGLQPDIISGTSAGAIAGAMYANGYSGLEIYDLFLHEKPFSAKYWKGILGFIETSKLRSIFYRYILGDSFEYTDIELRLVATDMLKGQVKIFDQGSVIDAILASAAFPGVFQPMEIGDNMYSDGGILNHFPADVIRKDCDFLIGMHLSPNKVIEKKDLSSTREILSRALSLDGSYQEEHKLNLCDIGMMPKELADYATFDVKEEKLKAMFDLGYHYIKQYESELIQLKSDQKAIS